RHGTEQYLPIERAFSYEHGSPYKVSDKATCDKLLGQIDEYDFYTDPIPDRIQLNKLSDYLKNNPVSHFDDDSMKGLAEKIDCTNNMDRKMTVIEGLIDFIHLDPELPEIESKQLNGPGPIELQPGMAREEIIQYLKGLRGSHTVADLAFYASRDLAVTDWKPFLKAALERNPVVIEETKALSDDALIKTMESLPNESIYNETHIAQPDEVWNFQRGDGLECAIALANVWLARHPESDIELSASGEEIILKLGGNKVSFKSSKGLEKRISL
ncbi:MAG: hypothetical protein JRC77_11145, partial [Deltaproteobacteria bacterium]|nr:hypothetical protein [Deltaproteobacteria bacterium]